MREAKGEVFSPEKGARLSVWQKTYCGELWPFEGKMNGNVYLSDDGESY